MKFCNNCKIITEYFNKKICAFCISKKLKSNSF